jgi:hypothetical protein
VLCLLPACRLGGEEPESLDDLVFFVAVLVHSVSLLLTVMTHFRVYLADSCRAMEAGGVGDVVLSEYQQRLRDRFLTAPVVPVGGLQGIGFGDLAAGTV